MIGKSGTLHAYPRGCTSPWFRCRITAIDASSKVHLRSPLSPIPAAVKPRLLTTTFSTTAFDRSTLWRFEASSCKATPKDLPSSHVQHGASAPSWHNVHQPLIDHKRLVCRIRRRHPVSSCFENTTT